jgi:uncharacterized protein
LLDLVEEPFDQVARAIKKRAEADRVFAIAFRRNVGPRALLAGKLPDPIRVDVLLGSQLDESLGSRGILDEPDMLTPDMKRIIEEQRLGFVATASLDGTPNVSPKGTFAVLDDQTIAFGEIRSPGTIRNLKANPRIEVNFVDAFVRKGYRFAGMATVVERGEPAFDTLLPNLRSALAHRIRAIVTIAVTKALPLTSPAYDEGKTEAELRRAWTTRFRMLQPFKRFEE